MNLNHSPVEIRDLTVTFSRWGQTVFALNRVDLAIPSGQWIMLVGHNGSGKSTLLKAICGRLTPSGGKITTGGKNISEMSSSEIAERMFYVHQDPLMGTAPKLTLFENLMIADYQAHIRRSPKRELVDKYRELLQPLGLADRMKQLARDLSGGERQLIALLIARLRPASLMLLDEPLAALDPTKAEMCLGIIDELHKEGTTIVEVTHDPTLAISGGERTVVLRGGRIVYDELGTAREAAGLQRAWSPPMEMPDSANTTRPFQHQGGDA